MFARKKSAITPGRIDTLIGAGTRIVGDVSFTGGLRVEGEIKGNVTAEGGALVVSEQARIEGDIRVAHLVINGTVDGALVAGEFLELQPQARVTGDVQYNTIEIHLGAVIDGRLMHQGENVQAVELKLAASQ
ncbi:MAG: polymer-forming cytoskeletal protein [Sterolibacterium sp.]|jgi:cytoskeletal protein CcmA (bactofilin family)|nr:polymer-forming cytoskeletal protein [Sterolibacterium sp.]